MNIKIEPELKSFLTPLEPDEKSALENSILTDGCRDALIVWRGEDILIDGHNRHEICTRLNIPFEVKALDFDNIEQVKDWMITNQLGRRNLTRERMKYFRGLKYERVKKKVGEHTGNQYTVEGAKFLPLPKTAETLAQEFGVSHQTIKNDAKYARSVNTIAEAIGQRAKTFILSRDNQLRDHEVNRLAELDSDEMATEFTALTSPNRTMKPKQNIPGIVSESHPMDRCQTPPHALAPILSYLKKDWIIWEPAAGEYNIVRELERQGYEVCWSDILDGLSFFEYLPDNPWHCQVTNPPYSIKYKWLERSYALGRPFALLLPLETLGAASGQKYFEEYGLELIVLNKRVNFKMPFQGYDGGGAQFPVAWFTWGLNIGRQITYGKLGLED